MTRQRNPDVAGDAVALSPWSIRDLLFGASRRPAWLRFVREALRVPPDDHPFHGYVGINFTSGGLKNVKFYFSYSRHLTPTELDTLLPVKDRGRFQEFLAQWHPTRRMLALHRGVTFALKVDADGTLTHYWHLRVKGLPFGPPERLELNSSDRDNHHGVCEEFTDGKAHLKRYFYLENRITISDSLAAAGMPERTRFIDLLEYIESDGRDKFSWVTRDPRLLNTLIHEHGGNELGAELNAMCAATGVRLYAPGSSRDLRDHAVYLSDGRPDFHYDSITPFLARFLGVRATSSRR
ncbi:MAG: hypothetical protein AB2A00_15505 [Myxococcota bacterium]